MSGMDIIDYQIFGHDSQYVEIELDPGEAAVGEAGAMLFMEQDIVMETVFGDGSASNQAQGFFGKLMKAGGRLVTGESLFTTIYMHQGRTGKRKVAFAAPYQGQILPMHLNQLGGELICQRDSFLCAAKGVSLSIAFQKKIGTGLFGGEGFIMQRLQGDGVAFVHAGGTLIERTLRPNEKLSVDTGCLAALMPSVDYDIEYVGGLKTAFFGGEGLFFASLTGPGKVWLQSLPLSRLANRIVRAAPGGVGETSVLGSLGESVMGGLFGNN